MDWTIDFAANIIKGFVVHNLRGVKDASSKVVLDTRQLLIKAIQLVDDAATPLDYELAPEHFAFGQRLEITLPKPLRQNETVKIRIHYQTTPECPAAGWLDPSLTEGKTHSYLYSQCQPIFARALVPCQDTPAVKSTYEATVRVPDEYTALLSAVQVGEPKKDESTGLVVSHWTQKIKIPSYLLAIAVGHLVAAEISPRCKIWTEPEFIEKAAWEFADTEDFLKIAEELGGPYEWGRFDMLVLPTSFPYGGMENPCLTFVTPALVAGDRSLVDVVAHEIAHSWTGNLVTNFDWPSFWLNEGAFGDSKKLQSFICWSDFLSLNRHFIGFTMVMERKITGKKFGVKAQQLSCLLGQEDLVRTVKDLGETDQFTALEADLTNRNPDDAFSSIPYEKGFNFLWYIQEQVGGAEAFDPYMKGHIQHFSGKSITHKDWKDYLYEWFRDEKHVGGGPKTIAKLDAIQWDEWLHGVGIGPNTNEFDKALAEQVDELAANWSSKGKEGVVSTFAAKSEDVAEMTPAQKMRFLDNLIALEGQDRLSPEALEEMDILCEFLSVHPLFSEFGIQNPNVSAAPFPG